MIAEPTRVTSTSSSLIDVLITSTPNSFERSGVLSTSFSDHLPIYGVLCGPSVKPVKHRYIETRSFSSQSMERFNADLELVPWNVVEIFSDIDDKYYVWQTLFLAIFNDNFPIRRKRIRQSTHPWLDNSILSTMRRRDHFHRKARKFNRPSDWSEYRRLRMQRLLRYTLVTSGDVITFSHRSEKPACLVVNVGGVLAHQLFR